MRLSDFQNAPTETISTTASLIALDSIATAAHKQVDWKGTRIRETQGARESDPWKVLRSVAKDEGTTKSGTLHLRLENLLVKDGTYDAAAKKVLHTALDEMIARASASKDSDEPESDDEEAEVVSDEGDDEEEMEASDDADMRRLNDAMAEFARVARQSAERSSARATDSGGRGYIVDADSLVVNKHLRPDMTVKQAMTSLTRLYPGNAADQVAQAAWNGLSHFMAGFPQDATKVKELPPSMLGPLLRHLEQNHATYGIRALDPRPA